MCVIQTGSGYAYSICNIYNREGNFYEIISLIVSMNVRPQPLKCHRICCSHFYSQPLKIDVSLHTGFSCICMMSFVLPNVTGGSWGALFINAYVLQLSVDAALLTSFALASAYLCCDLADSYKFQSWQWLVIALNTRLSTGEEKHSILARHEDRGLSWQWSALSVCSKNLHLNLHTFFSSPQHT